MVLGLCLGMFMLGLLLPSPGKGQSHLKAGGITLPSICLMKNNTGLPCPGCGLTRSWVSGLHGNWEASLDFHRLGWLVMLYAALQCFRHGLWLLAVPLRTKLKRPGKMLDLAMIPMACGLFINWILMLLGK